ncbi:hypothetical protein JUNP406_3192 [Acinetobacter baumannii]
MKVRHCPRNGNNVKHIFKSFSTYTTAVMWEGEYVHKLNMALKSGDLLVSSIYPIIHVG